MKRNNWEHWDVLLFGWLLIFVLISFLVAFRVYQMESRYRRIHNIDIGDTTQIKQELKHKY